MRRMRLLAQAIQYQHIQAAQLLGDSYDIEISEMLTAARVYGSLYSGRPVSR